MTDLYTALAPAVVRVRLIGEDLEPPTSPGEEPRHIVWIYTGFIINSDGRVLTSLGPSKRILRAVVEKDGLEYAAQYLAGDLRTRLALVQLLKLPEKIVFIPLDHDPVEPVIGTSVLAITHPFQLEVGPSPGYVIGYESAYAQNIFPCTYMRTNIALGAAEAGAPALDMHGRLVGVLTNGNADFRASYAVTLNSLRRVVNDLNKPPGRVRYGTLPVEFVDGTDRRYVARRVIVSKVITGGPAERAGLQPGDVLRSLALVTDRKDDLPPTILGSNEVVIRRMSDVRDMLFFALPGEFIRIQIERDGQAMPFFTLPVEALEGDEEPAAPSSPKNG